MVNVGIAIPRGLLSTGPGEGRFRAAAIVDSIQNR